MAKRPADLGAACTGPPAQGTCRYWRMNLNTLTNHKEGRPLTSGRNKPRTGEISQPAVPGHIIRLLTGGGEEAGVAQGTEQQVPPPNSQHGPVRNVTGPKPRVTAQKVVPEYVGPRLTGGQELAILFAASAREPP
eukprot:14794334-Heterocapsa_arctica.AAC.1